MLSKPLVMVYVKTLSVGPTFGTITAGAHIYVLLPSRDSAAGNEQAVDDALPFVLDTLFRAESVQSVNASRGDFLEKYPAWDIDVSLYASIIQDPEPDEEPDEEEEA